MLRLFFSLERVKRRLARCRETDVLVDAQNLHSLDDRGPHVNAMRDALGIRKVGRGVIDDQIVGINGFRYRSISKRAEINLLESRATESEHQKHAVGVWVVLGRNRRQVMVEVALQRIGKLICLERSLIIVVANFDRAISRQKLRSGISLEAKNRFEQKRVTNFAHALDGRAI